MTRIIELSHRSPSGRGRPDSQQAGGREAQARQGEASSKAEGLRTFTSLRAIVLESVGPVRHEVSVPFHDSQVRGIALLIQTGWDQYWGTETYWESGPFLAEHLIFRCVRSRVALIGVDFPISGRSTETQLITAGKIPIVEN